MWLLGEESSMQREQQMQGPRGENNEGTEFGVAVVWGPRGRVS